MQQWANMANKIRTHLLSKATQLRYESIIKRNSWPIDSVFKTIAYLNSVASSKSSLKQAVAAAKKVHALREWQSSPFDHPIVQAAIQATIRTPVVTPTRPPLPKVFSTVELGKIFKAMTPKIGLTFQRDATIFVIQLFGVRRASEVLQLRMQDITKVDDDIMIRIRRSKTDQQGKGIFLKLPQLTALGVNPTQIFLHYTKTHSLPKVSPEAYVFTTFQQYSKKYTTEPLSVRDWNKRLAIIQHEAGVAVRTSHAIRATAVSTTPMEHVHTVAQVGAWKSMTYLTTYHRTPIDDQARALATIGSRILLQHAATEEDDDE